MAIVNSRPLVVKNLSDPCGPEPLTPNHLLTMKSGIVMPPCGNFVRGYVCNKKVVKSPVLGKGVLLTVEKGVPAQSADSTEMEKQTEKYRSR